MNIWTDPLNPKKPPDSVNMWAVTRGTTKPFNPSVSSLTRLYANVSWGYGMETILMSRDSLKDIPSGILWNPYLIFEVNQAQGLTPRPLKCTACVICKWCAVICSLKVQCVKKMKIICLQTCNMVFITVFKLVCHHLKSKSETRTDRRLENMFEIQPTRWPAPLKGDKEGAWGVAVPLWYLWP